MNQAKTIYEILRDNPPKDEPLKSYLELLNKREELLKKIIQKQQEEKDGTKAGQ